MNQSEILKIKLRTDNYEALQNKLLCFHDEKQWLLGILLPRILMFSQPPVSMEYK